MNNCYKKQIFLLIGGKIFYLGQNKLELNLELFY
jgi:hypothetical protein